MLHTADCKLLTARLLRGRNNYSTFIAPYRSL